METMRERRTPTRNQERHRTSLPTGIDGICRSILCACVYYFKENKMKRRKVKKKSRGQIPRTLVVTRLTTLQPVRPYASRFSSR